MFDNHIVKCGYVYIFSMYAIISQYIDIRIFVFPNIYIGSKTGLGPGEVMKYDPAGATHACVQRFNSTQTDVYTSGNL